MTQIKNINLSELHKKLDSLHFPSDAQLSVTIEGGKIKHKWNRRKSMDAMKKLKGSGNGKLLDALIRERQDDLKYK